MILLSASTHRNLGTAPAAGSEAAPLVRSPTLADGTTAEFAFAQNMRVFPPAKHDALELEELLTPEERAVKQRVREFAEREIAPIVAEYWERAEFPHALVPKFEALGIGGGSLKGHGCQGLSVTACAMATVELVSLPEALLLLPLVLLFPRLPACSMLTLCHLSVCFAIVVQARVDGSMSTFFLVHTFLATLTLGLLGSEAQKRDLLPDLSSFRKVGAWALTEPSNGSDASALTTVARRAPGGWRLTGRKRWIGNATFADVVVVWARNEETGAVNAFVVRKGNPGFRCTKIENKIALRCVQNGDIELSDAFVADADRLPGVDNFKDTNKVLAISRVMVAWQPVGLALGAYDACARYVAQRRQFGAPLGAFQLVQEKLQRMLATAQAMWLMVSTYPG